VQAQAQKTLLRAVERSLDQRLLRFSRRRLVLCGKTFELYDYERPYAYNRGPEARGDSPGDWSRPAERRLDNLRAVKQRVRRLISTNVSLSHEVPKFVTFTFARNVSSLPAANRLWRLFCKRFAYSFGRQPYLSVVEFQKRGAVHYHVLYFAMPFTAGLKPKLAALWSHGFVHVKGIAHVRNVPAYLTKYLQKDLVDSRLAGQKAFFCSRGLAQPIEVKDEASVAVSLAGFTMATRIRRTYLSTHFGRIDYSQGYLLNA